MAKNKTQETDKSVYQFLDEFINDEAKREDSKILINLMSELSGYDAKMWGPSIIGFGAYHYIYESGREGDMCRIGFSPRKGQTEWINPVAEQTIFWQWGLPGSRKLDFAAVALHHNHMVAFVVACSYLAFKMGQGIRNQRHVEQALLRVHTIEPVAMKSRETFGQMFLFCRQHADAVILGFFKSSEVFESSRQAPQHQGWGK